MSMSVGKMLYATSGSGSSSNKVFREPRRFYPVSDPP